MKSVLVLVALLLVGCSATERFTAHGSLALTSDAIRGASIGSAPLSDTPCSGTDGASSLTKGARVKVSNATGTTIALGYLDPGKYHRGACTFTFTVLDIPAGLDIYGVTVSGTDEEQFTRDQMNSGPMVEISYTRPFSQF